MKAYKMNKFSPNVAKAFEIQGDRIVESEEAYER